MADGKIPFIVPNLQRLDFENVGELHNEVKAEGGKKISDSKLTEILTKHYNSMMPLQRYSFLKTCGFGLEENYDPHQPIKSCGRSPEEVTRMYRQIFLQSA